MNYKKVMISGVIFDFKSISVDSEVQEKSKNVKGRMDKVNCEEAVS